MPNALTLEICRFAMIGEPLSEEMEVWQVQRIIRERLGMQQVCHIIH